MDGDNCSDAHKPQGRGGHTHSGGHSHAEGASHSHGHSHGATTGNKMILVLCLTSGLMLVEVVAGLASHSLALLADAGHMLSDVAAQVLALLAMWFSQKPANERKSFGYYRTEILASLLNGVLLVCISGFVMYEGVSRLMHPGPVEAPLMLGVAVVGLAINIFSMRVLHGVSQESLNIKAAYLELMGDMLASAGVVVAASIIYFTKWYLADPIISILIGIAILPRTWLLIAEATNILMEGTPAHINVDKLQASLLGVEGVTGVHDIHVWTITSGFDAMSAHVKVESPSLSETVLNSVTRVAREEFGIQHTTIQIELPTYSD
jgi:cobalt-zinc-cadmium efflux system protein